MIHFDRYIEKKRERDINIRFKHFIIRLIDIIKRRVESEWVSLSFKGLDDEVEIYIYRERES